MDTNTPIAPPDTDVDLNPKQPAQTTTTTARPLREPLRTLLFALGIGFLADALFRGGAIGVGINAPIIVVLFLVCFGMLARREGATPKRTALALFLPPLLFFAAMLAVRANPSLTFYNLWATGILLLLFLHFSGNGNPVTASFGAWLGLPWKAFGGTLAVIPPVLKRAGDQVVVRTEQRERYAAVIRGVLLAIPVLIVFGALFANADSIFAERIQAMMAWLFPSHWGERAMRLGWVVATALLTAGGFAYSLTRHETPSPAAKAHPLPLGSTEAGIVLGTVSALFGTFLWTQTRYLFGGDAHVQTVPNLTYAQYAHHGFTELNVVAVLTLALIGALKATTRQETMRQSRAFSLLSTILLTLTFPLLSSAFSRMTAYEAAYGATELRLYVDVFMAWLAVGLFWSGATLWRPIPGGIGVYVCAVGFLFSLNVLNPDREIALRNIERYQRTGRIDREYLSSLSEDALPELMRLRSSSVPDDQRILRNMANRFGSRETVREWGAWNLSRMRARRISKLLGRDSNAPMVAPVVPEIIQIR